jgi:1,2-diacylglycerol 3-beta-glucosyltransferase
VSYNSVMLRIRGATKAVALTFTTIGGLSSAHLLLLLGAALWSRGRGSPNPCDSVALAVVIPAHDEEMQIAAAVASVQASSYPPANRRIVVVADNCTDQTAAAARAAGAEVWERSDPVRRGKGYALAWAFERLLEDDSIEALGVIDADCEISANLLGALAARLRAGADAVQASYLVSNPDASTTAALRWAGFALFNVVRPLGRDQLGLSSGLLGTGMAISRRLMLRSPWQAFSYAEDREQHMRWVLGGARVAFAREAEVRSPSPSSHEGSRAREARWESGRAGLAADLTPKLLARWLRTGDLAALDAALEPVLPPQSLLLGTNLVAVAASRLVSARVLSRLAAASLVAQSAYVLGGLVILDAPAPVWRALLSVPPFLGRRVAVMASSVIGRGPSEWQRTPRHREASTRPT